MGRNLHALIPDRQGSQYTREQVQEAAAHYVVTGSVKKVAELTGIPRQTVSAWRQQDWWEALSSAIRHDHQDELDGALSGLIRSSVAAVQDRLDNGELKSLKVKGEDGERVELVRVPVTLRDATLAYAVAFDKRQISRNLPTSISESGSDRLRALQDQLRQISGRTIDGTATRAGANED